MAELGPTLSSPVASSQTTNSPEDLQARQRATRNPQPTTHNSFWESRAPALAIGLAAGTLLLTGAAAAAKAINRAISARTEPLPDEGMGEQGLYPWPEGTVAFTETGSSPGGTSGVVEPLLLVHEPAVGGGSWEWRHNAQALAERFDVFTLDLLGFGGSAKPLMHYTSELYVRLLGDFIREVVGRPVNVVASGLSAAYVTALACREPGWFKHLVLVCPTGIQSRRGRPSPAGRSLYHSLSVPIAGEAAYNSLAGHARIEADLRHHRYHDGSQVTDEMVDHAWTAAHQPGARWAIRSLLSGYLNIDICEEFRRLERPVTLVWGQQAHGNPVSQADAFLKVNPDAELEIFSQAGRAPHEERPDAFNRLIEERIYGCSAYSVQLPRGEAG